MTSSDFLIGANGLIGHVFLDMQNVLNNPCVTHWTKALHTNFQVDWTTLVYL